MASTASPSPRRPRRMRICLSVDFDALSGYLGTGHTPENTLADYSAGLLSAHVGVPRLLRLFRKHGLSDRITWFVPGHSMETFPRATAAIVASGAEIGLHGYSHEGAYAMTPAQEREVLEKCIGLARGLYPNEVYNDDDDEEDEDEDDDDEEEDDDDTSKGGEKKKKKKKKEKKETQKKTKRGRKPLGYRAPLYQIRESTVALLQEYGFLYDSSMNAHDGLPYWLPHPFPQETPHVPDYAQPASTWMVPTVLPPIISPHQASSSSSLQQGSGGEEHEQKRKDKALVEIPASWYTEDMTPLGFYPYTASTQGYVATDVVEKMWWDRFEWLWEEESFVDARAKGDGDGDGDEDEEELAFGGGYGSIYPMIWHPESAGRAHIVGMIDRFLGKLVEKAKESNGEITFECMADVATSWREFGTQ